MRRTIATIAVGCLLALAPMGSSAEESATQHLEHLVVENADTPAEHQALARYFRMKAADARSVAAEHRAMGNSYGGPGKVTEKAKMKKHCERIAELNNELASQYEALAEGEDAAAGM